MTTTYTFDIRQLEDQLTIAAHIMTKHLADEGLLDTALVEEINKTRIIVIRKPSKIHKAWKKIFKKEDDNENIYIAKIDII